MRPKEHLPTTMSDLMLETCSKVRQPLSHLQREQDLIIENPPYRETLGQFPLDLHVPMIEVFIRVNSGKTMSQQPGLFLNIMPESQKIYGLF